MPNETLGNHEITTILLFPWNRRDLTSLVDEKGKYLGMDDLTLDTALAQANAHIARMAAQSSPTFPVEFDDSDEEEDDDEPVLPEATGDSETLQTITRANAEDGERPE